MKRYSYGQNFQVFNSAKMVQICPLGTLEVAPGDTVTGKFTTQTWSDSVTRPILNRTYYDTFAFYIPYRLLWDGFPEWVVDESRTTPGPPLVSSPYQQFVFEDNALKSAECLAWNRRAYKLIYNKYFKDSYAPELDITDDSAFAALGASQRPTTWHESAFDDGTLVDEQVSVNVVGETISIKDLRRGFTQDRFRRVRDFYGDKYTDYLASLGVKASWSIADEPELIGKASKDWTLQTTNATVNGIASGSPEDVNFVGDPAGYFRGTHACRIRPTFCPEHGLIFMVGVARMETVNEFGNCPRDRDWET